MTAALLKGFEVELFTGRIDGTVVGCSAEAAAALEGFVTEPDHRNLEYITPPASAYGSQRAVLLAPRRRLRPWPTGCANARPKSPRSCSTSVAAPLMLPSLS